MKRLREDKIDNATYYETVWGEEFNTRPYYDTVRQEALASKVKAGDYVVDLGAGVFGTAQFIAEILPITEVRLFAYDQSHTAKNLVDKLELNLIYKLGPLPKTSLTGGLFDVVIAGEVIEHMDSPAELVAEMARLCHPGGWLCISTVDTNSADAIAHGPYPEHLWEFDMADLVGLFLPYGETEYKLVGDYHMIFCQVPA